MNLEASKKKVQIADKLLDIRFFAVRCLNTYWLCGVQNSKTACEDATDPVF